MIRSPRRSAGRSRLVLAALVTAGGVVLAGCAAGQDAQTARQRPTIDGVDTQTGLVALRNIAIEYPEDGVHREGSDAPLRLVLVNTGETADTLVEVRTDAANEVVFAAAAAPSSEATGSDAATASPGETASGTPTGTPTETPTASGSPDGTSSADASQTPSVTESGAPAPTDLALPPNVTVAVGEGAAGTAIVLKDLTRDLRSGQTVSMTFVLRTGGTVTVKVPVATPYEEIEPAPTIEGGEE